MLDISNPDTINIFKAAALEDKIRAILVELESSTDEESSTDKESSQGRREIVEQWIPKLRALNVDKFGDEPGINATLDRLENAVNYLSVDDCWQEFCNLTGSSGENFGTWAI